MEKKSSKMAEFFSKGPAKAFVSGAKAVSGGIKKAAHQFWNEAGDIVKAFGVLGVIGAVSYYPMEYARQIAGPVLEQAGKMTGPSGPPDFATVAVATGAVIAAGVAAKIYDSVKNKKGRA